jgi:putative intracellular protease/amidase
LASVYRKFATVRVVVSVLIGLNTLRHHGGSLETETGKVSPLVKGKRVAGFTNGEEEAVHLTKVVPFLVEDELKRIGGLYGKAADWESFAVVDGRLVTGQNPTSSTAAARELLSRVRASSAVRRLLASSAYYFFFAGL